MSFSGSFSYNYNTIHFSILEPNKMSSGEEVNILFLKTCLILKFLIPENIFNINHIIKTIIAHCVDWFK